MPFGLGFGETLLIFAVILLVFGPSRAPEMGAAFGKAIRDFKNGLNGIDTDALRRDLAAPQLTPAEGAQPQAVAEVQPAAPALVEAPEAVEASAPVPAHDEPHAA